MESIIFLLRRLSGRSRSQLWVALSCPCLRQRGRRRSGSCCRSSSWRFRSCWRWGSLPTGGGSRCFRRAGSTRRRKLPAFLSSVNRYCRCWGPWWRRLLRNTAVWRADWCSRQSFCRFLVWPVPKYAVFRRCSDGSWPYWEGQIWTEGERLWRWGSFCFRWCWWLPFCRSHSHRGHRGKSIAHSLANCWSSS